MPETKGAHQAEVVCQGSEGLELVIVTPIDTPLGTIRHSQRQGWRCQAGQALT